MESGVSNVENAKRLIYSKLIGKWMTESTVKNYGYMVV